MKTLLTIAFLVLASTPAPSAEPFRLTSNDVSEGQPLGLIHHLNGFGCTGGNFSPALQWSGVPGGTKSFVITLYDPDATSGSGWWHWSVYNIPVSVTSLPRNAGAGEGIPKGAVQGMTDFGGYGFAGACPPSGQVHRYEFRVHALSVEQLELPENATPAMVGFMTRANAIDVAKLTAVVTR
jgi:Raf kinase inhibitor-like YbhB/YbcL family protein